MTFGLESNGQNDIFQYFSMKLFIVGIYSNRLVMILWRTDGN